jgi:hypothetical protein
MHRTTALNHVSNHFADENLGTGFPGTRIEADDQNTWQEELCNAVTGGGLTLDSGNDAQLAAVIDAERNRIDTLEGQDLDGRLDALETPADGSAGVSWQTGWANAFYTTRLYKFGDRAALLEINTTGSAGLTNHILTLPVGYRPAGRITGVLWDVDSGAMLRLTAGGIFPTGEVYAYGTLTAGHEYSGELVFVWN